MNDEERRARQTLLHAGEPGDRHLAKLVGSVGPVEAVEVLRCGRPPVGDGRQSMRAQAADLDAEDARAVAVGARLVCPGDQDWPERAFEALARNRRAPYALWVRGPLALSTERAVAIVGARASTAYGDHLSAELASGLADLGWVVVSGAAYGIDGAAHRGCLAMGGGTMAVLAGGVDDAYPKGHHALLTRIAAEGLVISELPLGESPSRSRFLERNRLIAALGVGTVAVEMALRSGARNTLEHAHALLRPVMAVPGPATSAMSAGCHEVIRSRFAELVCDAEDVVRIVAPLGECDEPTRRGVRRATDRLSSDALAVYEALPAVDRVPLVDLDGLARLPAAAMGDALRELLLAGVIEVAGSSVSRLRPTRRRDP